MTLHRKLVLLKTICIEIAVKLMRSQLLSKLELALNQTCKTLQLRIVAKLKMHLLGNLIKLNQISEILLHGSLLDTFIMKN